MSPRNYGGDPPYPKPEDSALTVGELIRTLQAFDPAEPVLMEITCHCCANVEWVGRDQATVKPSKDAQDGTSGILIGFEVDDDD